MATHQRGDASEPGDGHAVVIGAGFAGLTAARALAGFMDRVTVLDRDPAPRGVARRRGVPQARHAHSLPAAGLRDLEQLFPEVAEDLDAAGAVRVRVPEDMLLLGPRGWLPRVDTGLTALTASRDLIDSVIRDRIRADPKVTLLPAHEAVALEPGRNDTITGVWVRGKSQQRPGTWEPRRLLSAEFVVDATGHGSRAPQWLAELGYGAPEESVVDTGTTCVSSVFAPPVGHVADWTALALMPSADHPHYGVLYPIEGGRWAVTLSLGAGAPIPRDHGGLIGAAAALRDPVLRDVLTTATPLGPVYATSRTATRWRHYERMRRWPDQFLVLGDALATLNPVYGQGMTMAVRGAIVLDQLLTGHGTTVGLSYRLRRALAHRTAPAWQLAGWLDLAHPGTAGARPSGRLDRFAVRRLDRLAAAAATDPHAATTWCELLHLHAPPRAALRPRALAAALRGPRETVPASPPPSTTHGPDARRRVLSAAASAALAAAPARPPSRVAHSRTP